MRASRSVAPVFLTLSAIPFASSSKALTPWRSPTAGNPYPSAAISNPTNAEGRKRDHGVTLPKDARFLTPVCGKSEFRSGGGVSASRLRARFLTVRETVAGFLRVFCARLKRSGPPRCYRWVETRPDIEGSTGTDLLAGRLADGDPAAPGEMVGRHRAELVRYATALLRDAATAEDAVQEAFSKALDALGRYPEERVRDLALRAWLFRITLNVVRNHWRRGDREVPVAEVPEVRVAPEGHEAGLDALSALAALPERQRVAVALRYLSDLPHAEVSEATGWPEATCRTLARRGIGRLRLLMSVTEGEGGS